MKLEEVILRDTRASQPAATTVPVGTLYFVTDEYLIERSNGSVWQTFSSAFGALATEILADSPRGFWKCNEASGTLSDSSGNGYHLDSLTGSFNYQWGLISPLLPTTKFINNPDGSTQRVATRAGTDLGIAVPWTGDISCEAIVVPNFDPAAGFVFSMAAVGETEATNYQFALGCDGTTGILRVFWEQGAGTNESTSSGVKLVPGVAYHIAAVKDGTANTVDFYINGHRVISVAYSNEPSGGGSCVPGVGGSINTASDNWRGSAGYVALYNSKLSEARIMAHALAAGLA